MENGLYIKKHFFDYFLNIFAFSVSGSGFISFHNLRNHHHYHCARYHYRRRHHHRWGLFCFHITYQSINKEISLISIKVMPAANIIL